MENPIPVYVGYDRRIPILYHVTAHSIARRSTRPVSINPLSMDILEKANLLTRPLLPNQSTEFAFSRFLAPYIAGYKGWIIFMDNDMVVLDDIANLYDLRDDRYAVMCVKHDHQPTNDTKFLGEKQTVYEKKNWSSVMLMNAEKCKALTPEYVNTASGLELHRFHWLENEDEIGEIPPEWNNLVGVSDGQLEDQKLLHFTDGGPYYEAYKDCKWANVWLEERAHMLDVQEKSLDS